MWVSLKRDFTFPWNQRNPWLIDCFKSSEIPEKLHPWTFRLPEACTPPPPLPKNKSVTTTNHQFKIKGVVCTFVKLKAHVRSLLKLLCKVPRRCDQHWSYCAEEHLLASYSLITWLRTVTFGTHFLRLETRDEKSIRVEYLEKHPASSQMIIYSNRKKRGWVPQVTQFQNNHHSTLCTRTHAAHKHRHRHTHRHTHTHTVHTLSSPIYIHLHTHPHTHTLIWLTLFTVRKHILWVNKWAVIHITTYKGDNPKGRSYSPVSSPQFCLNTTPYPNRNRQWLASSPKARN